MDFLPNEGVDLQKVRKRYNDIGSIWDKRDSWHEYTGSQIRTYINRFVRNLPSGQAFKILNAGSGGNTYGITEHEQYHVDIAESKLQGIPNSLISSVEEIPIASEQFDICLCVGSVINYCDAVRVIQEFHRLIRPSGWLVLEFENSRSPEYFFNSSFDKSAVLVTTFYQSQEEVLWAYAEEYIRSILLANGFAINDFVRFHIVPPIIYRLTRSPNVAAKFARFDRLARRIPYLNGLSSNVILTAVRRS